MNPAQAVALGFFRMTNLPRGKCQDAARAWKGATFTLDQGRLVARLGTARIVLLLADPCYEEAQARPYVAPVAVATMPEPVAPMPEPVALVAMPEPVATVAVAAAPKPEPKPRAKKITVPAFVRSMPEPARAARPEARRRYWTPGSWAAFGG